MENRHARLGVLGLLVLLSATFVPAEAEILRLVGNDFDGDGTSDLGVFRPSTAIWYRWGSSTGGMQPVVYGAVGDLPVSADFDGDGKADLAIFRPSTATWYALGSFNGALRSAVFGATTDIPVPADFDGDGKADLAVFRPSTATWYRWGSHDKGMPAVAYGAPGDLPIPADFDGDGRADLAVFRPSTATWYVIGSTRGPVSVVYGTSTDIPVPADYDGDGRADRTVFRPSTATWYMFRSSAGARQPFQFGVPGDRPLGAPANGSFGPPPPPPPLPTNMVLIPAGSFVMGDGFGEGDAGELPLHNVYVNAFYMDKYEVTQALWNEVKAWATNNGYAFEREGWGKAANHPVHTVNWRDAVKWCNARSQKDALTPCYTTNGVIYKTGTNNDVVCNWSANGYRLPTDAEWEKAARGGAANTRFPWTDYTNKISHAKANYYANPAGTSYDVNPTEGLHPIFATGGYPYTSPVGYFAPNGYGLYDMSGNIWEWVWDWFDISYYSNSPNTDPRGPASSPDSSRGFRGGSWSDGAFSARCALHSGISPNITDGSIGFRCAKGL